MLFDKIELESNEQVLTVVRKHWLVIVAELFGSVFFLLIPLLLYIIIPLTPINTELVLPYSHYLWYITGIWMLFSLLAAFMVWTHYFLDLWIVTDRRIIVIDQVRFFNRKVSSFRLERLQDIKVSIDGFIPTIFNFGTIKAQTASAAESNFASSGLPDPRGIQSVIQKAMDSRLQSLYSTRAGSVDETLAH